MPGTASVSLQGLTIDGSAASTEFTGCGSDFVGVYYHDASGSLNDVDVTNVELPTELFGCQDGLGIYVAIDAASVTPSNVTMSDVSVTSHDKNGITCDDVGTVCAIGDSQVSGIGPTPSSPRMASRSRVPHRASSMTRSREQLHQSQLSK
jgi:hypothetical protein